MPTTRKQKKVRKSREQDMLPDIDNLDIMLGGNSLDREERISSNLGRKPENPSYGTLLNQNGQPYSNSREAEIKSYAQNGHITREVDSSSECNSLSGDLNQRISQEMGDFMSTVHNRD